MTLTHWLILGGALAALLVWDRFATTTADVAPAPWDDSVQTFAAAIAYAEGYGASPDNAPTRANNPGDLKVPNTPTTGVEGVSVFPSIDAGWQALTRQVTLIATGQSHIYRSTMTIREIANHWTDTEPETWAANVAAYLQTHGYPSVTPDTSAIVVLA